MKVLLIEYFEKFADDLKLLFGCGRETLDNILNGSFVCQENHSNIKINKTPHICQTLLQIHGGVKTFQVFMEQQTFIKYIKDTVFANCYKLDAGAKSISSVEKAAEFMSLFAPPNAL